MLPTDAGRCRRKPRWMAAQFLDRALHSCLAEQSGQPEVITAPHQLAGALLYRVEHGPHAVALQQLVLVAARRLRGKVLHYQPLQPAGWNRAILHMTTATRKHEQQRQPGGSGSAAAEYAASCPRHRTLRRMLQRTEAPGSANEAHRSTSSCAWRVSSSSVLAILHWPPVRATEAVRPPQSAGPSRRLPQAAAPLD